jgi:TPR repeat protein
VVSPAADRGHTASQVNLGTMYDNGQGVPQDYVYAYMWLQIAAAKGDRVARKARETLTQRMTPGQIAEAQGLVRQWKPIALPSR